MFSRICFLSQEKSRLQKSIFFIMDPLHFKIMFSITCGTLKKIILSPGVHFRIFGKLKWVLESVWGSGEVHFGKAGGVCVCGECHGVSNDMLNDMFLRCVFERHDVKSQDHCCVLPRKNAFGGHASLQPADPSIDHLFEHPTAACPRPMIHTGQKCPAILRDWDELDAERAVSWARSTKKKSKGERSGEHDGWNSTVPCHNVL